MFLTSKNSNFPVMLTNKQFDMVSSGVKVSTRNRFFMLMNDEWLICMDMEPFVWQRPPPLQCSIDSDHITKSLARIPLNEQLLMLMNIVCSKFLLMLIRPISLTTNETNDTFKRTSGISNAYIEIWLLRGRIDESPTPSILKLLFNFIATSKYSLLCNFIVP